MLTVEFFSASSAVLERSAYYLIKFLDFYLYLLIKLVQRILVLVFVPLIFKYIAVVNQISSIGTATTLP